MYNYVSDVLCALNLDPKDVFLIRHTENGKGHYTAAREAGYLKEYTSIQNIEKDHPMKNKLDWCEYIMVFNAGPRFSATYFALYRNMGYRTYHMGDLPADYPYVEEEEEGKVIITLGDLMLPDDLHGFTIDWGKGARCWHQYADHEKLIVTQW